MHTEWHSWETGHSLERSHAACLQSSNLKLRSGCAHSWKLDRVRTSRRVLGEERCQILGSVLWHSHAVAACLYWGGTVTPRALPHPPCHTWVTSPVQRVSTFSPWLTPGLPQSAPAPHTGLLASQWAISRPVFTVAWCICWQCIQNITYLSLWSAPQEQVSVSAESPQESLYILFLLYVFTSVRETSWLCIS